MQAKLEAVLDEFVRPALRSHGGDMEVLGIEDGMVRFRLLGQCAGCPSAYLTTEELIQEEVLRVEGIKGATLVQQVSEDLLQQAREIMKQRHA